MHSLAKMGRIRQTSCHHIPWRDLHTFDIDLFLAIQPEHMQRLEHIDELLAKPVFERHPPGFDPARHKQDLLMLHVDHVQGTDPLGKFKRLMLRKRFCSEPALVCLPDDRRVQTFLDRGPDGKRRGKVITIDRDVRAIANADFLNLIKQIILGITGKDICHTGLDADTYQRK